MNAEGPILVVAPLKEELAALLGRIDAAGTVAGRSVVAAVVGDGHRRARAALRDLLACHRPRALIGIGVSGGLDPERAWGDVLASGAVLALEGAAPAPDAAWVDRARVVGLPVVPFAVAPRIVPTPEAKAALRERLGGEVACVDLESAVFAEEAAARGVPYLVVRAVVDDANDTVSKAILAAQDEDGHVVKAKVALAATLKPSTIRTLKGVQKRVQTCAARLADAVQALLAD